MFVLGNLFIALAKVIELGINIYIFLIVIRAIISWLPVPHNPLVEYLYRLTDPFLDRIRGWIFRMFPTYSLPLDFSPILAILLLYLIRVFAVSTLVRIGISLKGGI